MEGWKGEGYVEMEMAMEIELVFVAVVGVLIYQSGYLLISHSLTHSNQPSPSYLVLSSHSHSTAYNYHTYQAYHNITDTSSGPKENPQRLACGAQPS